MLLPSITRLLFLLLFVISFGCSDKEKDTVSTVDIVGRWDVTSIVTTYYDMNGMVSSEKNVKYTDTNNYKLFNADNTYDNFVNNRSAITGSNHRYTWNDTSLVIITPAPDNDRLVYAITKHTPTELTLLSDLRGGSNKSGLTQVTNLKKH